MIRAVAVIGLLIVVDLYAQLGIIPAMIDFVGQLVADLVVDQITEDATGWLP